MVSGITPCAQECKWTDYFGEPPNHGEGQTSATTAQARLPVRWIHARDVYTHADFTRPRRWCVDLAKAQDISGRTEFCVIGSTHAFSSAFLDRDSPSPLQGYAVLGFPLTTLGFLAPSPGVGEG
jgi:hypothetical protein